MKADPDEAVALDGVPNVVGYTTFESFVMALPRGKRLFASTFAVKIVGFASVHEALIEQGPQVDLLVFDGPPKALNEDVVSLGTLTIQAGLDLAVGQRLDEVGRGELIALIRVEDFGRAVTRQRLLHSFYAKIGLQRDRYPSC